MWTELWKEEGGVPDGRSCGRKREGRETGGAWVWTEQGEARDGRCVGVDRAGRGARREVHGCGRRCAWIAMHAPDSQVMAKTAGLLHARTAVLEI